MRIEKWRILVGKDADYLDERVRCAKRPIARPSFEAFRNSAGWRI
jgi:hypothetical protein